MPESDQTLPHRVQADLKLGSLGSGVRVAYQMTNSRGGLTASTQALPNKGIRVLVLDAEVQQSLAACRALGRAGYDVAVAGYGQQAAD